MKRTKVKSSFVNKHSRRAGLIKMYSTTFEDRLHGNPLKTVHFTDEQIINLVKERNEIDFRFILDLSKNKKQFKNVLRHFNISESDIKRYIDDAELYEPKLRR